MDDSGVLVEVAADDFTPILPQDSLAFFIKLVEDRNVVRSSPALQFVFSFRAFLRHIGQHDDLFPGVGSMTR